MGTTKNSIRTDVHYVNAPLAITRMSTASTPHFSGTFFVGADVVSEAKDAIYDLTSEQVRKKSIDFLNCLANVINIYSAYVPSVLPMLKIVETDESSALFEWVIEDSRFGFRIDACDSKSYWYLVARKNDIDINMSGGLSNNVMFNALNSVVLCVLGDVDNVRLSRRVSSQSY